MVQAITVTFILRLEGDQRVSQTGLWGAVFPADEAASTKVGVYLCGGMGRRPVHPKWRHGVGSGRKWVLGGSVIGVTGLVITPGRVGIRMRGVM